MKRWKRLFLPVIFLSVLFLVALTSCDLPFFGPGIFDYQYNLSGRYGMYRSSSHEVIVVKSVSSSPDTETVVPKTVTGIAWDSDFILASREDRESSAASKSSDYWIIDVKSGKVYGPLSESAFTEKRKALRVSEKLTLVDPDRYKSLDSSVRN